MNIETILDRSGLELTISFTASYLCDMETKIDSVNLCMFIF
jgi:hypothetical protein